MSLYKDFATNKQAEVKGVLVEFSANDDNTIPGFIVSRMSRANKKYTKALEKATRPHRRAIELETMNNDLADKIFMEVFVDTVLLGWQNVQDKDGKPLVFNRQNAIMLFTDLPELYDDLQDKAKKAAMFRDEAIEGEAKN